MTGSIVLLAALFSALLEVLRHFITVSKHLALIKTPLGASTMQETVIEVFLVNETFVYDTLIVLVLLAMLFFT